MKKCNKKESCYETLLEVIASSNPRTWANEISRVGGFDDCLISIVKLSEGMFISLIDEDKRFAITRMYVELDRTMLDKLPTPSQILFEIEKEMKTEDLKSFLWGCAVL